MLGYIKTGFKNLILKSKIMLILLIATQIFSVIVIMLSFGIVNHYNTKVEEVEGTSLFYKFRVNRELIEEDEVVFIDLHQARKFFNEVLPIVENKLDYFFVLGTYEDTVMLCSTGYKNGKYTLSSQLTDKTGIKEGGSLFTEEEVANGEKYVILPEELNDGSGYFYIGDERYKVKGIMSDETLTCEYYIIYGAIPECVNIGSVSLLLKKPLLESEYNTIVEAVEKYLGDKIKVPEFDGINNESDNRVYRDIIVVSLALIFVFAVDYCIMYMYILEKRRRIFAVSRICGGSRFKISITYMIELLGLSFATFVAGVYIFNTFVLKKSVEWFEYIEIYCTFETYKRLGVIYMAVLFVAYLMLIVKFVRKTPVSLIKEV